MTKSQHPLPFPDGFLWGTASAAHQVEGHNSNNDWWEFEHQPDAIWHGDLSGPACDWWHNAEVDFDLMAKMGHNTHRLSIEWSRIEPKEGVFDPAAIARYREMLTALRQRNIEPMVTLHHFSTPRWLGQHGGWPNVHSIAFFRRFAAHAVEQLGDLVKLWCTINEPSVYSFFGYLFGEHAPGDKSLSTSFRVLKHLLMAHAAAYRAIHAIDGNAQVGIVKNIPFFEALDPANWASVRLTKVIDHLFNELVLKTVDDGKLRFPLSTGLTPYGALVDSLDFIGVNYYSRERVSLRRQAEGRFNILQPTPGAETSDHGRNGTYGEVYPEGLYLALKRAAKLGKPIYVTENGLPDYDDDQRPSFLLTHLAQIQRAIAQGIDVRGYYHWAFTDNFEWAEGWTLRFGLVALDETTQKRMPRPSAGLYTDIIEANAITPEMVRTFAPELIYKIWE